MTAALSEGQCRELGFALAERYQHGRGVGVDVDAIDAMLPLLPDAVGGYFRAMLDTLAILGTYRSEKRSDSSSSLVDGGPSSVGVHASSLPPDGVCRPAPSSQHGPGAGHSTSGGVL